VYGPHQDPFSEYAAVIPKFISNISKNESPIVYGDGEQTRDFSFISDVVTANILAAENKVGGVYNISGGKRISINNLIKIIMEIYIKDLPIIYDAARSGDIKHSLADISKAKEKLGYEPKFDLTKGLTETIAWYQKQV
jgi:nucleoside-diphosphate-sugar epimerase